MANCIFNIGSVTQANKAKQILSQNSVFVKIIKLSSTNKGGCSHGIEFSCNQKVNIVHLLLRSGINFEEHTP